MIKTALRVVVTFSLLVGTYMGYTHVFATATRYVSVAHTKPIKSRTPRQLTRSAREAQELSELTFGKNHWTNKAPIRYYVAERGYWMYAEEYKRKEDGRQLVFEPFAIIWRSNDGRSLKTATSKIATLDFNQPIDLVKPGNGPARVVRAEIEGDVQLRDDKGTPQNGTDDLMVTTEAPIIYNDDQLLITSEGNVVIQDRDLWMTGDGLRLVLRPNPPAIPGGKSTGFTGAQTAFLNKNVHIVISDVGNTGILPGQAKPEQQSKTGKTPVDLKCVGEMRIDLPPPEKPAGSGPATPPKPTFAHFSKNVVVQRGVAIPNMPPDQLDSDFLDLELVPADKTVAKTPQPTDDSVGGPLNDLTLHEAVATGHAVFLVSQSQGLKGRVNKLVHTKQGNGKPDLTQVTAASANAPFKIEKEDVPPADAPKDTLRAITTIRALDATIHDTPGLANGPQAVYVKGRGTLETRPARNLPVQRTAVWNDKLTMLTQGEGTNTWREIRLFGHPEMSDLKPPVATTLGEPDPLLFAGPQVAATEPTVLKADDTITILLKPKPADPNAPALKPGEAKGADAFRIDRLHALKNVIMTSPGKTMTAKEELIAEFTSPTTPPKITTKEKEKTQRKDKDESIPVSVATTPILASADPAKTTEPATGKPKVEPPTTVNAAKIWARLTPKPENQNAYDIDVVRLDRQVVYHQDPAEGKIVGTHLTGEALDLNRQPGGTNSMVVTNRNRVVRPTSNVKLITNGPGAGLDATASRPAKVVSDDMAIQGPVIGLDQERNFAWDKGPGRLTQWTERGKISGFAPKKKPTAEGAEEGTLSPDDEYYDAEIAKLAAEKVPVTISWAKEMQFFGKHPVRAKGWPTVAKAFFVGDVRVRTEVQTIDAEEIDAWLDQPVDFSETGKPKKEPVDPDAPEKPKPQLAKVFARKNVYAVNIKRDPKTNVILQKQVIVCDDLQYDKRTGDFLINGQGRVYLFDRDGNQPGKEGKPKAEKPKDGKLPGLVLIQIDFRDRMIGRFAQADDGKALPSNADFYGDVQVLRAPVADEFTELDADVPNRQLMSMSSQELRVLSEPRRQGEPNHYTLAGFTNAVARDATHTAQGDRITYDSATEVFFLYGLNNRPAVLAEQIAAGQPGSKMSGKTIVYNAKTQQKEVVEPGRIQFMDAKIGVRPAAMKAQPDEISKKPQARPNFKLPTGADKERRGFNGR